MNDFKINVTGWKVIPLLLVVLAIVVYKYNVMNTTLDAGGKQAIKTWVLSRYIARGLDSFEEQNIDEMTSKQAERAVDHFLNLNKIDINSIKARGKGDDIIVRAEITVDGKTPPDGKSVRYFRMEHSMITGWRMKTETTSLWYHLKLW